MAFSGVRSWWSSRTSSRGTRTPAAAPHGDHNFLPQTSVVISDRTRQANKLGEGSFAKVYRGEYNGKPCAVKVLKEDIVKKELTPDPRGTSEVELLSKVQHTNIVKMYGMWLDPYKDRAAPSIVMELCDESLCDFIRRFKGKILPKEKKLRILQDIARGMVYLHSQNIVHGDLRSSNVLLCHSMDQTVAKLADFDMARLLDIDTQHHFTDMFTAEDYLPPEVFDHNEHKDQKKKRARLTPKVDVFCFGELVLEMGCGTYPTPTGKFQGQELLTELQRREKHLAKLKQSDKESLGSIIQKCLADAPEGRPSFTEILQEIEGYLHRYGERPDLEMLQDKIDEEESPEGLQEETQLHATMDFFKIRNFWSSRTGSGGTKTANNFLPQDSVIISDQRVNRLGEGSFAKVYRGEYNGKPCAVKVFKEGVLRKELILDPGSEVKTVSKKEHKNIVKMYGMWLDPHKDRAAPSIVMELCDESLYDFIRFKGRIVPKEQKLAILQDIAKGMVYLHGQNIVHGDLRSNNVLLCHSEDQTVAMIADFDMARFLDTDTQHHFTTRFTAEEYLPPEVFSLKEHKDQEKWARLSPKVDVFCFGELVLEMGCGSYPTPTGKFHGKQMLTELQRREKHLLKLKQSDKESLGSIIQKCLADAPEGRPSFTEILQEVEGYLHMHKERPDLEMLQDKTAECEALRTEAVKWEGEAKSLSSMQDKELERVTDGFAKKRQELQTRIEAGKKDKLMDVQRREQDLNDQLQLCLDQLEATKFALQVEKDKLHITEESVRQKEKEVKTLKGDLQSERDKVQTMEEAALQKEKELDQCKARKAAVEKDLARARKMAKDLLDIPASVNAESEQKMENLNEKLMEFKQQAVLSEERLKQMQGLEGEHQDLKIQLKTLTTILGDFQKVLTDEQKSRKSLDASIKALTAEIDQLRTELKERDNEVSSLAAANKHLQRKVDAADANSGEMKAELTQLRTELKERDNEVSSLSAANEGLQWKVDAADAYIAEMKEKLREAEQQVALFQGKRQQLKVLESVAVELKSRLSGLMMDAPSSLTPSVGGGEDGSSAQKMQLMEREREVKLESKEGLEEQLKEDKAALEKQLKELQERNARLEGQLTERRRVEEKKEKELRGATSNWIAADKWKAVAEAGLVEANKKNLEVCKQLGSVTDELGKAKRQLSELKEEYSTLQDTVSQIQKENDSLQNRCSDLEADNAKLQAAQKCAEELLEAGRDEYRGKPSDTKELIMQHLCTQDKESSHEHLLDKTQFNAMIKFFKEKLREAEQQVALLQDRQQQLEYIEGVAVELKTHLSAFMMDALPLLTPSVGSGEDDSSVTHLTQEAVQKLQLLESERDSLKAERHMYQMKWLAAEDMMEAMKNDRQSLQDERDSLLRIKDTLEQEKKGMMAKQTGLEEELRVKQEDLGKTKEKNAQLRGQLGVAMENKHELEALRLKWSSAVAEKARTEEKLLAASNQVLKLEEEAGEAKRQLHEAEDRCSDLEADKAKLQASQRFAEELEAEKDDYKGKLSNANELIMQHFSSKTKGGSPEHLPSKTEFHAMMEFFKVFYDKSSKQSEQTAEENQRLLAKNNELKEKVQEMAQATLALQEKLSEKEKFLDEQQREIAVLREELSPLQEMKVVPSLASDVFEQTVDEVRLEQLCYMATGIKQLLIGPDGGTFKLGSGDASLEFPPRAVVQETSVRYAIILHGPFVFPAGYKPGSVVVYLNMDGATLVKPVLLYMSHWCLKKEGVDKDILKFFSTPHTLEAGQQVYEFEEQEKADFTTRSNVGVLTIQKPQCLYCVEAKVETIARYCAIMFSQNIPSEDTLRFMVQLMCDSLDWMEHLTNLLQQKNWEKTSDTIARFQYATGQQIVARLRRMTGPGWEATIDGHHAVVEQDFLQPMGKSARELKREVTSGRFPPSIRCKVIYTSSEEERVKPALVIVDVDGANGPLSFSCRIKEEKIPAQSVKVARSLSSPLSDISNTAVIKALNHELDARWREFGTHLCVKPSIMDIIDKNKKSDVGACMLHLVESWLSHDNGTGDLPRTWETVVQAVKSTGKGRLAEQLAQRYGVQPPGQ